MRHGGDPTLDALCWAIQSALNEAVRSLYSAEFMTAQRLLCYAAEIQAIAEEELDWRCSLDEDEE